MIIFHKKDIGLQFKLPAYRSNSHPLFIILALFLTALISALPAQAQRVQPMSYELAPSGSKAATSLRIENTSKVDMTLELIASRISVDGNGIETRASAEDDFLIFPPQLILKSGKTQAIRVKYIGEPILSESSAYRISLKQIPIDLTGSGQSRVGMVVNFHTLAHVTPPDAEVDLQVNKITKQGADVWAISIVNRGKKMGRLSRTQWKINDGSQSRTFTHKEVADMTERNLVMPGRTLNLNIPAIEGFDAATTSIKINVLQ